MSATEETLSLLRSIDASLKRLVAQTVQPEIADDRDLDSQWGDPLVKFSPRDWTGENCKGRKFSECPAGFLDLLAQTFDYFARKADDTNETHNGKLVAPYKRKDAARARGWAKRIRGGYQHERQPEPAMAGGGDGFGESSEWADDPGF